MAKPANAQDANRIGDNNECTREKHEGDVKDIITDLTLNWLDINLG
jgi:hypothetical protein